MAEVKVKGDKGYIPMETFCSFQLLGYLFSAFRIEKVSFFSFSGQTEKIVIFTMNSKDFFRTSLDVKAMKRVCCLAGQSLNAAQLRTARIS